MDHDTIISTTGGSGPSVLPEALDGWVRNAAERGLTPAQVRTWLAAQGWPVAVAEAAALHVERTGTYTHQSEAPPPGPVQTHEHPFAYITLLVTVGLAALSLGSVIHLVLEWAFDTRQGSQALANWITLFLCTVPFAVAAIVMVRRIEADDPLARYSKIREELSLVLLWAAGLIGGARLLLFVHQLVSALVVDRDVSTLGRDQVHVITVVTITGALFAWTWRFRHPR
jgi:cytochrome bd-type quinol oxidase subunit 2